MERNEKASGDKFAAHQAAKPGRRQASSSSSPGFFMRFGIIVVVALVASARRLIQPPPPRICGSPDGPPVTATRIQLKDGRHLAYLEQGVPREKAKHSIIFVHGFDSCRKDVLRFSPELLEELEARLVSYDRPGYGESDPHPGRTEKTAALDIEELADSLQLGVKFYVIGFSMGGQVVWSCLRHIPHRLAGAALLAPVANFWWPGIAHNVSHGMFEQQSLQDKWAVSVAHYAPWLTYWWNTQKLFPPSSVVAKSPHLLNEEDIKMLPQLAYTLAYKHEIRPQGDFESLYRDMIVGFGSWGWSPVHLSNPFPDDDGAVHLWHGSDDRIVPPTISRYLSQKLPWITYHEVPAAGHIFPLGNGMPDVIVRSLLVGE